MTSQWLFPHLLTVFLALTLGWASTYSALGDRVRRFTVHWFNRAVVVLCLWSMIFEGGDLLALTLLQVCSLTMISCAFALELGEHFRMGTFDASTVFHHALGIVGTACLVWNGSCGGMMMRLYLDITTHWVAAIRGSLNRRDVSLYIGDKLYWIYFFLIRFCWYPLVLLQTAWLTPSLYLKSILLIWLLFSLVFHAQIVKTQFYAHSFFQWPKQRGKKGH